MTAWPGTGLYGKLPLRGDFITRTLPYALVDQISDWLVSGLDAAGVILGDAWDEFYMSAPIWRFALPPGCIGHSGTAGLLMPSVDASGRQFPLLALTTADLPPPLLAAVTEPWYAATEDLLLNALAGTIEIDRFDSLLATLPDPRPTSALSAPLHHALTRWPLSAEDGLWWTQGAPRLTPGLFLSAGLPMGADFATILGHPASGGNGLRRVDGEMRTG